MGLKADRLTTFATDQIMELLGIAGYMTPQCNVQMERAYVNGWIDGIKIF